MVHINIHEFSGYDHLLSESNSKLGCYFQLFMHLIGWPCWYLYNYVVHLYIFVLFLNKTLFCSVYIPQNFLNSKMFDNLFTRSPGHAYKNGKTMDISKKLQQWLGNISIKIMTWPLNDFVVTKPCDTRDDLI